MTIDSNLEQSPIHLPLVKVEQVDKLYGSVPAVLEANLQVQKGQRVVILGASGSGKSTLLRCINHLEVPTRGVVWIDGEPMGGRWNVAGRWIPDSAVQLSRKRQQIGMVFQGFHLFAHLKVIDNVAISPRKVLKQSKSESYELAYRLLQKVHLDRHAQKYPAQLSGGEQQRVAIARALAMNPKLMLFDEPTSALDPRLTHEVLHVMQQLAEEGMTMIVVTHEIGFARKFADTIVFMEHGRIVETGKAEKFFTRPQHEKTQQFLSYVMN